MSAKPTSSKKNLRGRKAVASIAKGSSVAATARTLGVSARTVQRDLAAPSSQALLLNLLFTHEQKLEHLFAGALGVIEDAMAANKVLTGFDKKGKITISDVPDFGVRLNGVARLTTLLGLAGRDLQADSELERGTLTWEQFKWIVDRAEEVVHAKKLVQAKKRQTAKRAKRSSSSTKASLKRKPAGSTKAASRTSRSKTSGKTGRSGSSKG